MKKTKKKYLAAIFIFLLTANFYDADAFADEPEARAVMEKVDARDDGDNMTSSMEMILIDKKKKRRIRKIRNYWKDKGKDKDDWIKIKVNKQVDFYFIESLQPKDGKKGQTIFKDDVVEIEYNFKKFLDGKVCYVEVE